MDQAVEPHRIADDTWVIGQLHKPPGAPVGVFLNSMVIRGSEPIIVDTGTMLNREQWMADAFSLVELEDVGWIFLSHDDHDHVGNLLPVMEAAPNATLVTSWFSLERQSGDYELPLDRVRWVNNGEYFDAGDRRLTAITPPMFDAPTTEASSTTAPASTGRWTASPPSCLSSTLTVPRLTMPPGVRAGWSVAP